VFDLSGSHFLELRDAHVECFRTMNSTYREEPAGLMWFLWLQGHRLRFAGLLLRQFHQPTSPPARAAPEGIARPTAAAAIRPESVASLPLHSPSFPLLSLSPPIRHDHLPQNLTTTESALAAGQGGTSISDHARRRRRFGWSRCGPLPPGRPTG